MAFKNSFIFILCGLTGVHSMARVSEVSVKAGTSISIPCVYEQRYENNVKYLCQGYYWDFCEYAVKTNQRNNSKYSISDDKKGIFTTTIMNVKDAETHFWCAVEINNGGDVRYYFHLSVTTGSPSLFVDNQHLMAVEGKNISIKCHHLNSGGNKWCRLRKSCVAQPSDSSSFFVVTMRGLRMESSGWYMCVKGNLQMPVHLTVTDRPVTLPVPSSTSTLSPDGQLRAGPEKYLIALCLLILLVMLTVFIWFLFRRQKRGKAESPPPILSEEEVSYSTVMYKRNTVREGSDAKSDEDVTYSSVVITNIKNQSETKVEETAEEVTYSTLTQCQKNL